MKYVSWFRIYFPDNTKSRGNCTRYFFVTDRVGFPQVSLVEDVIIIGLRELRIRIYLFRRFLAES